MLCEFETKIQNLQKYQIYIIFAINFSIWLFGRFFNIYDIFIYWRQCKFKSYHQYFLAVFMCIYILKYYFKKYKLLQYSILFIKNPKLSLTIFCIENLSLIILYLGILYIIINKYFFNDSEYANSFMTLFGFLVAPVCMLIFVITYMLNERKF